MLMYMSSADEEARRQFCCAEINNSLFTLRLPICAVAISFDTPGLDLNTLI